MQTLRTPDLKHTTFSFEFSEWISYLDKPWLIGSFITTYLEIKCVIGEIIKGWDWWHFEHVYFTADVSWRSSQQNIVQF